jgi:hypothetical protein
VRTALLQPACRADPGQAGTNNQDVNVFASHAALPLAADER